MLLITQPTFIPWLGYFDLIDQSETTVFLDDVKFSKQSWQPHQDNSYPKNKFLCESRLHLATMWVCVCVGEKE